MRLRHIPGSEETVARHPLSITPSENLKGQWATYFSSPKPLEAEIGMGKGQFITTMAQNHPEKNFLGFELYSSVMLRALQKIDQLEQAPCNLRFVCADAANLDSWFDAGEIDTIYLNFSDPWPKDRHAKRRLTSAPFLSRYQKVLNPQGHLEFKTDNQALFAFSLEELKACGWNLMAVTDNLHEDPLLSAHNTMTEYEEKFSSLGHPICKLIAGPPKR